MKENINRVLYNLCTWLTIVIDLGYLISIYYLLVLFGNKVFISGTFYNIIVWILASLFYYLNKYSCKITGLAYLVDDSRKIFGKNTIRYLIIIVYMMIKYYSMISLLAKLKYYSMDNDNLKCILDFFAVLIVIILVLELAYQIIGELLMWVVLIIVLILIFGLFKMEDGVINWVFLALLFISAKDMLSPDIKYLNTSDKTDNKTDNPDSKIDNLNSENDIKLKSRIVDLKYSLLLIIPTTYLSLRILEKFMKTGLYKKLFLLIMLEKNNNLLEIMFESSVKLCILFLIINFVYRYRGKVFKKIKDIISKK